MKQILSITLVAAIVLCAANVYVLAQELLWIPVHTTNATLKTVLLGEQITVGMKSAPFPHPKRSQGHTYKEQLYPADKHYSDSSVRIFLPHGFAVEQCVDVVVYLHGWYNSIDTATAQFNLLEQFAASRRNAVFVFPEGPKFVPDSFGGKLEDEGGLASLVQEVFATLSRTKKIKDKGKDDKACLKNIILAGHSGAYRAIAFMLLHGGIPVREVWLFDALYGHTEKFAYWLSHDCKRLQGRFVNIYTDDGGTKSETENLMRDMKAWKIPFHAAEESSLVPDGLRNAAVFIHTELTHNEVIAKREQFWHYLETSCLRPLPVPTAPTAPPATRSKR